MCKTNSNFDHYLDKYKQMHPKGYRKLFNCLMFYC